MVAVQNALVGDGLHGVVLQVDPRAWLERGLRRRERHALPRELVADQHLARLHAELLQAPAQFLERKARTILAGAVKDGRRHGREDLLDDALLLLVRRLREE
eukprot:3719085-Prymnesium_polylepis.2